MSQGAHMLHLAPAGPMRELFRPFLDQGLFEPEDLLVAGRLARRSAEVSPHAVFAAALALRATRHGSSCARLDASGRVLRRDRQSRFDESEWVVLETSVLHKCKAAAARSPLTDGERSPFVLHGALLFARRYDALESEIPAALRRIGSRAPRLRPSHVESGVKLLFADDVDGHQAAAVRAATQAGVTLLTGGPGTGKTYTVRMLLAIAYGEALLRGEPPPRVLLAAPTGKAAVRVSESLRAGLEAMRTGPLRRWVGGHADEIAEELANLEAMTIHRMLGWRQRTPTRFRHDEDNPLRSDWVVIDEASMIDLPLMARLLRAIHPTTRLVLIGDPDQLPSVGPGAVLADLASRKRIHKTVHHARLARRRRFGDDSEIALCADAIAEGARAFRAFLSSPERRDVRMSGSDDERAAAQRVAMDAVAHAESVITQAGELDPSELLARSVATQVLCAHRRGAGGVEDMNRRVLQTLRRRGHVPNEHNALLAPGVPVIVRVNDPSARVFNGDVGICVPAERGGLVVYFDEERVLRPRRLPAFDLAFALTVHQSQGSEFEHVVVSLPFRESPLLSRGLLYTAVTRAKATVTLVGDLDTTAHAADRSEDRDGYLRERF